MFHMKVGDNTGGTGRGKDEIRDIKRGPAANMPVYKKGANAFC